METEWEATFWPIDKDDVRSRLKAAGGTPIYAERLMRRVNYYPPDLAGRDSGWVRVRDEGDRITMSLKRSGSVVDEQKEAQVVIHDFDAGKAFLEAMGCVYKNYQESKRELWKLMGAEITIDEWPWLEPLVEVEGISEEHVRDASEKLGFDWLKAYFVSIDKLYAERYTMHPHRVTRETPRLVFEGENPFQNAPKAGIVP